jgi:hypothetical protein
VSSSLLPLLLPEHGLGGAQDLPISRELAILGAAAAVAVSFVVLALAWRTPRYDGTSGRPAPAWLAGLVDSTAFRAVLRAIGLVSLLYLVLVALAGKDLLTNPIFGIFYVWIWVGFVPASLLFGRVWKAISPWRLINTGLAAITGADPDDGLYTYPRRVGMWPGALGLFAFVWFELVDTTHNVELGQVTLWCAVYLAAMVVGGALFGNTFYANADPFEVYSSLVAQVSVWGRRNGVLVIRSPLANLDSTPPSPGLLAVVAVLFGSTAFDAFRESTRWLVFIQGNGAPLMLQNTLGLIGFCAGVGAIFYLVCVSTRAQPGLSRRLLPGRFAHSLVPIIVGYIVAHYLSYFVEIGTYTLVQSSDPLGNGSDILGTGGLTVPYWLSYHPTFLAECKVLAVVTGHVVGVIAAHERAIKVLPERHQLTGQLPLLAAMIAFTVGGLYLLFST